MDTGYTTKVMVEATQLCQRNCSYTRASGQHRYLFCNALQQTKPHELCNTDAALKAQPIHNTELSSLKAHLQAKPMYNLKLLKEC